MREENIKVIEAYLEAVRRRDLSAAPLAENLVFENPMTGRGEGLEKFQAFLNGFLPAIRGVKIIGHICENDRVATRWDADTEFGIVSIGDFFQIEDGLIVNVRAYFDPRPLFG